MAGTRARMTAWIASSGFVVRNGKITEFRHPLNNYRLYRRDDLAEVLRGICEPTRRGQVSKKRERATG